MTYDHHPFSTTDELHAWLEDHHDSEIELWVRIYKKASNVPSVTWDEVVITCLAWGWIDGQKRSLDKQAYLQRISPRRRNSNWSMKNRKHIERLIEAGEMRPSGMVHVEAAKADGRWERAYAGQADMVLQADFVAAVEANPTIQANFDKLTRPEVFKIYCDLQTARTEKTRARRFARALEKLS